MSTNFTCVLLDFLGMIGPSTCKYQYHIAVTKHRPQLGFSQKQSIHERAMSQGEEDPLKTNYTRYFNKVSSPGSKEQTLDQGHLRCLRYHTEQVVRVDAAVRIQSIVRARFGRSIALSLTKQQAYRVAKALAVTEMEGRVVNEFRRRENSTGAAKTKWDAQVNTRQNKLLLAGQSAGRNTTVMLMMEESVEIAKEGIMSKLDEMEDKEDFSTIDFSNMAVPTQNLAAEAAARTYVSLFDIFLDKSMSAQRELMQEHDEEQEQEQEQGSRKSEGDEEESGDREELTAPPKTGADGLTAASSSSCNKASSSAVNRLERSNDPLYQSVEFSNLQVTPYSNENILET